MRLARRLIGTVSRDRFDRDAVTAGHTEPSAISSVDDLEPKPTDALIALALDAVRIAAESATPRVAKRCSAKEARYVETWPGEHYRLLPAIARAVEASTVVEVGTFTGLGALSLAESGARVVTYDVLPWDSIPGTVLVEEDLSSIEPRLGDLADPDFFESQLPTLSAAELLFVDGPKDGHFEPAFVRNLENSMAGSGQLLMFDDIRVMTMLQFWRDLPFPKLDLTSFGHWSGTGLAIL